MHIIKGEGALLYLVSGLEVEALTPPLSILSDLLSRPKPAPPYIYRL